MKFEEQLFGRCNADLDATPFGGVGKQANYLWGIPDECKTPLLIRPAIMAACHAIFGYSGRNHRPPQHHRVQER